MKVAIVSPYDWSYPGGVRTHISGLAAALGRLGAEVEILAPASRPEEGVFALGSSLAVPANGSLARICFSASARRRIAQRLGHGGFDLMHLHEPAIPSTSLLALTASRLPCAATFHAAAPRSLGYAAAAIPLRRLMRRIDRRIAVSGQARALISSYFPGDYALVPNGVDVPFFAAAAPDSELSGLKPFVLFVGRNEPRKGFGVALAAVQALRSRMPVRLVAAGVGGPPPFDWVTTAGTVEGGRLASMYAAADVFCAPSLGGESFGIVLIEAMAAGAPVVCSDLPGYAEAAGAAAQYSPPGDAAALADRLGEVLSDPALADRLREAGHRRAAELDWDQVGAKVLSCYEEVLGARGINPG